MFLDKNYKMQIDQPNKSEYFSIIYSMREIYNNNLTLYFSQYRSIVNFLINYNILAILLAYTATPLRPAHVQWNYAYLCLIVPNR